jgi:phosphorylase/glycogen(starch) synthase
MREWENIDVLSLKRPDMDKEPIFLGKEYEAEVVLSIGFLQPSDIGVEMFFAEQHTGEMTICMQHRFTPVSHSGSEVTYKLKFVPNASGTFSVGIRIYADNKLLPHRQDFCMVKWL